MKEMVCLFVTVVILCASAPLAFGICVDVPKANIRTGPGTSYDIAWEVYQYMPFLKVGESESGDWYAIKDLDGDVNWIHRKLVTDQHRCAAVKKEVNVRTGPGTNYAKSPISPAAQYYSFKVVDTKGAWVKVQDEWNNVGWIHTNFLWIQ